MKNGILTFHRTANFGSCLQAYALYQKIVDLGHECELIDYRCSAVENREGIGAKRQSKSLKGTVIDILQRRQSTKKYRNLMMFLEEKAKLGKSYSRETICQANGAYDRFIVGSDIVWGTDITEDDYTYFLDFVRDHKKKFAFSSSIGNCEQYVGEQKEKIRTLLSDFSRIAVRESDAAVWVSGLTGKQADFVCDPTMLLTAQEWDQAVKPKQMGSDYVLIYFIDEKSKIFKDAIQYAKENGLKVYYITKALKPVKGVKMIRPSSLAEFIGLIKHANFVFTASYHGMLFSLYYQKQFLFYKRAHGSRVISLANYLGVEGRCGNDYDASCCLPIDYNVVESRISQLRAHSTDILQEMLESEL